MTHGRAPVIAIGAAAIAVVVAGIAVVVSVTRDAPAPVEAVLVTRVPAERFAELRRDAVREVERDGKVIGVRVADEGLRLALGLAGSDVITHLAGRAITRELDLATAMIGARSLDASIIYAEIVRDDRPASVRWEVIGELRKTPLGVARDPKPIDPLVASVEKLDELRYAVPRSTIDRVLANPIDYTKTAHVMTSPAGITLKSIRSGSLFAALGFQNGDTIRAINGHSLTGIDMPDAYLKIRDARELAIDITRRGTYELITIVIK